MKTLNFVHGCSVFGNRWLHIDPKDYCVTRPISPSNCQYCYVYYKMLPAKGADPKEFHHPKYYPDKIKSIQSMKTPEIFVGSIMGDFLSPDITDRQLIDIFETIEQSPQHIVMLLSKNPMRYARFRDDAWKRDFPSNAFLGTSVECDRFAKRIDYLREVKQDNNHLWVEIEPLLGRHDKCDFTDIDYVSCSALGRDQIYQDSKGNRFNDRFNEEWMQSIIDNQTLNIENLSIYHNITDRCFDPRIKNHVNSNLYHRFLHKKRKKVSSGIDPLW